jgi:hypothetical protein
VLASTLHLLLVSPGDASAQDATESPTSARPAADPAHEDRAPNAVVFRLVEPDYRLINLPTTTVLPARGGNFDLTHRFLGNLARGEFSDHLNNLFGLDEGAQIGVEVRYAIAPRVQVAAYRTTFGKTFQFHGQLEAVRQGDTTPVSIAALLSVEGTDNFTERRSPALGAAVSRTIGDRIAAYAVPIWAHNTGPQPGVSLDTFFVGLGGRVRLGSTVYVVGEVVPRVSGYAPGPPEFGFGVEKRAGRHMFQLNMTNAFATTFGQMARGGFPTTLYLGFNLARKFF